MAHFDMPLHELHHYRPPLTRESDFEQFWSDTLAEAARQPLNPRLAPLDLPYTNVRLFQAAYDGWHGAEIIGTCALPVGEGPFPAVALYHGYASRPPEPFELLGWVSQGYAVLATSVRGQSGGSSDTSGYPGGHAPGFLTLGIGAPHHYYYRGAFVDAVRAIEFLAAQPDIDRDRIVVTGGSQGGALTLAVVALHDMSRGMTTMPTMPVTSGPVLPGVRLRAAVAEIPFLCHFERAATLMDTPPYTEIGTYCRRSGADWRHVLRTLSYFDCMNLASYITTPTLITAGLMDSVCPPSTIFATYNHISAEKDIIVDYFGEHEAFPGVADARMRWFTRHM